MRSIIENYEPLNDITRPLSGTPTIINSGIIKTVMNNGDKISVASIDYEKYDDENFQYVFTPYWEIIDGLPASVFQGIPGIDMDMRLRHYYRVNYEPVFITERTPSKNREDLWDLLEMVGMDYYDRYEWLLRTSMVAGNDNLIVERRRNKSEEVYIQGECLNKDILRHLQYGDKIIVDSMASLGKTASAYEDNMFYIVTNGIDIVCKDSNICIDITSRTGSINALLALRLLKYEEYISKQRAGIEKAKAEGKYKGRKPIHIDEVLLGQVIEELDKGIITVKEAMKKTGITSRSTFYRKVRKQRGLF